MDSQHVHRTSILLSSVCHEVYIVYTVAQNMHWTRSVPKPGADGRQFGSHGL